MKTICVVILRTAVETAGQRPPAIYWLVSG
jgi:hypothetical protein